MADDDLRKQIEDQLGWTGKLEGYLFYKALVGVYQMDSIQKIIHNAQAHPVTTVFGFAAAFFLYLSQVGAALPHDTAGWLNTLAAAALAGLGAVAREND